MGVIADLIVNLRAEVAQFRSSMDSAATSIDGLQKAAKQAGEAIASYLAVREVISAAKDAVAATQEWALSIERLNTLTGVGAIQAGALAFAAKENGIQIDSLQGVLGKLSRELVTHEKAVVNVAGSIRDAGGQYKTMPAILDQVVAGLLKFREGADRDAAAASILGKGVAGALPDLIKLHEAGALTAQGMADSALQVEKFGLTVDASGIAKAREYEKALNDLSISALAIKNQFGQALLPEIEKFSAATKDFVQDREHMEEIRAAAQDVAHAIVEITGAIVGAIKLWNEHKVAIGIVITVLGVLAGSFVAPEIALGAIALRAIFFIGALVGIKSAADGVNESLGKLPGAAGNLQKILDSKAGKFEPFKPAGQGAEEGTREFVDSKLTESLEKETAKIKEQIAMLSADHAERNRIALAQAEINELTEKGVSASSAAGRAIVAAVEARERARAQLEIVKPTAAAEDSSFANAGQLRQVQASAEASRAVGEQIAVESALRKANVAATDLQSDAVQKLVAATRAEYQSKLQLSDAQQDKSLRENIQTQREANEVSSLNHGLTVQEIQDRRDLETRFAIEQMLTKDNLAATSAEGEARAKLVGQVQAQKFATEDLTRAQAEVASVQQPLEKYVQEIALYDQQLKQGLIDQQTFNRLLDQAGTSYTGVATQADRMKEVGKTAFEDIGSALIGLSDHTKTFMQSVMDLNKTLVDLALKELVIKQIERSFETSYAQSSGSGGGFGSFFGSLFGGGGGGAGAAGASGGMTETAVTPEFHTGGVSGSASSFRSVSSSAFAGARSYHSGRLGPNEEAAILEKGEGIIPRGVMEAARSDRGGSASRRGDTINQSFNYQGPDADGFLASRSHMLQDAARAMRNSRNS